MAVVTLGVQELVLLKYFTSLKTGPVEPRPMKSRSDVHWHWLVINNNGKIKYNPFLNLGIIFLVTKRNSLFFRICWSGNHLPSLQWPSLAPSSHEGASLECCCCLQSSTLAHSFQMKTGSSTTTATGETGSTCGGCPDPESAPQRLKSSSETRYRPNLMTKVQYPLI